ncbi:MAG: LytTR family transcriptional regulator, partial [Gammaproteobacteria bacterium]|nr:LytTR family transcriptional regulator [Gammaproteobacteria bacterium]
MALQHRASSPGSARKAVSPAPLGAPSLPAHSGESGLPDHQTLLQDHEGYLEEEFGDRVVRIHRNALVMMEHLEGLERRPCGHYQVRMRDVEERLDVSRRHVSGLR